MKCALDKEKANLEDERRHNIRLLELNEAKDNEIVQTKECHGKYKVHLK